MSRPRSRTLTICLALVACGWLADNARADITVDQSFPVRGQEVRVQVRDAEGNPIARASIEVTYRPASRVEKVEPIGVTAEDGSIVWIPAEAGIAQITATWPGTEGSEASLSTAVSVRFASPPIIGIFIMVAAGLLLVVGSAIRMFNLLRTPQEP